MFNFNASILFSSHKNKFILKTFTHFSVQNRGTLGKGLEPMLTSTTGDKNVSIYDSVQKEGLYTLASNHL